MNPNKEKTLGIAGGGDFSRLIVDLALDTGRFQKFRMYDDTLPVDSKSVFGRLSDIESDLKKGLFDELIVAIGYKHFVLRNELFQTFDKYDQIATLIHPTSFVSPSAKIGRGCLIYSHVNIEARSQISNNVAIFNKTSITHDSIVGSGSFLSVGVAMGGRVKIGSNVFIGVNATLINDIEIGDGSIIAAGTLVSKNAPANSRLIGNPFRSVDTLNI